MAWSCGHDSANRTDVSIPRVNRHGGVYTVHMSTPIKAVEILPGRAAGSVRAPASKSYANRALLLAALAEGESVIHNPLQSDDTEAMTGALRDLGVDVRTADDAWIVRSSGRFNTPSEGINCRDSGTTLRLTAASALSTNRPWRFGAVGAPPTASAGHPGGTGCLRPTQTTAIRRWWFADLCAPDRRASNPRPAVNTPRR